jgi:hypothetical protein
MDRWKKEDFWKINVWAPEHSHIPLFRPQIGGNNYRNFETLFSRISIITSKKAFLRPPFKIPLHVPTRLLLGMLGYNSLLLRRNLALLRFVFQLMKCAIWCPTSLDRIRLNVSINFLRGRHHEHLAVPASRTNLYRTAPLPRVIRYINGIIAEVSEYDVFHMNEGRLSEIASSYLFRLHYQDETDENLPMER